MAVPDFVQHLVSRDDYAARSPIQTTEDTEENLFQILRDRLRIFKLDSDQDGVPRAVSVVNFSLQNTEPHRSTIEF